MKQLKAFSIYDTTLRDGMQAEKVSFSLEDKLEIAKKLDEIGIHFIEGGCPYSNEKEMEFFKKINRIPMKHALIAAFGSTRIPGGNAAKDPQIAALLKTEAPVVTVVGKSWDAHVREVIGTDESENFRMIEDTVKYFTKKGRKVFFDAEHFFDGFKANPAFALKTITVACEAGAELAVLCDTNGGAIHTTLLKALEEVKKIPSVSFGVHLHNDTGMAVGNSLLAVDYGCKQIQGTINGWGERCGNANLCTIIPNIHFKINNKIFTDTQLKKLTSTSRYISECANIIPDERQPYVGLSAFAHKAGQHADVVNKNPFLMEHLESERVGNERRILISELAGKGTIARKIAKYGKFDKRSNEVSTITKILKEKENDGFEYEAAEASFDLVIRKALGKYKPLFDLLHYEVEAFQSGTEVSKTFAKIKILIQNREHAGAAVSNGPVAALDAALRSAAVISFPFINDIKLVDYKVRVLNGEKAAGAKVRVFIKSSDGVHHWETVGVSENIIEASWQALIDSYEYIFNTTVNRKKAKSVKKSAKKKSAQK
jgi:2-isopropylmalate synthase